MSRSTQKQKTKAIDPKWLALGLISGCIVIANIIWYEFPRSVSLDILLIIGLAMSIVAILFTGNDGSNMGSLLKSIPLSVIAGLVIGAMLFLAVGYYLLGGIE